MFAAHYKLGNLCVIVDNNGLQIDGPVAKVMSPYPIDEKLRAFGFHVENIDGHDFDQIEAERCSARCWSMPVSISGQKLAERHFCGSLTR